MMVVDARNPLFYRCPDLEVTLCALLGTVAHRESNEGVIELSAGQLI